MTDKQRTRIVNSIRDRKTTGFNLAILFFVALHIGIVGGYALITILNN